MGLVKKGIDMDIMTMIILTLWIGVVLGLFIAMVTLAVEDARNG